MDGLGAFPGAPGAAAQLTENPPRLELRVRALAGGSIARATGISGYLGAGTNRWPATDTRDVARVYRLALESAPARSRLHAVAEEGMPVREIAETIGRRLKVPVAPVAARDAERHFSYLSAVAGLDNPTSSQITRETLGWTPTRPGLIADLGRVRDLAAKADETSGS